MTRVSEVDFHGLSWNPNAPEAVLIVDDFGLAVLALNAHPDDA